MLATTRRRVTIVVAVALIAGLIGVLAPASASPPSKVIVGPRPSLLQTVTTTVKDLLAKLLPLPPLPVIKPLLPGLPTAPVPSAGPAGYPTPHPPNSKTIAPVRIGTMNVQWLPRYVAEGIAGVTKDLALATTLAQRIKASNYDVIALNEVFDEKARAIFVKELHTDGNTFPYYVSEFDDVKKAGNSGLMLFSKFPAEALNRTQRARCLGNICDNARFHEYNSCTERTGVFEWFQDDCEAAKGVGLVRLRNPADGTIINVAFSHTQASYQGDEDEDEAVENVATRHAQLLEVTQFVNKNLSPQNLAVEPFFLMGDLNVDGDSSNPSDPTYLTENREEYMQRFQNEATRMTVGDKLPMIDSWVEQLGTEDLGKTNRFVWPGEITFDGARLDYILHTPVMPWCQTHLSLANNLRSLGPLDSALGEPGTETGGLELSDHIGLNLDLSRQSDNCTAKSAIPVATLPLPDKTGKFVGTVAADGSAWYQLTQAGSYAIGTTKPNEAKVQLYTGDDMSAPILPYKDLTQEINVGAAKTRAPVFALPHAPIYLRVFRPNRTAGDFTLLIHRRDCTSWDEYCPLLPALPTEVLYPGNETRGPNDAAFFRVDPEVADSGDKQDTKLQLGPDQFTDNNMKITRFNAERVILNEPPTGTLSISASIVGGAAEYFEVQRRSGAGSGLSQGVKVTWTTNLTVLGVLASSFFMPDDQGDEFGDEEYYLSVYVDGILTLRELSLGSYGEDTSIDVTTAIGVRRYLKSVRIVIHEVDNANDGDPLCLEWDYLDRDSWDDDCITFVAPPLSPLVENDLDPGTQLAVGLGTGYVHDDDEDGVYLFKSPRSHYDPRPPQTTSTGAF